MAIKYKCSCICKKEAKFEHKGMPLCEDHFKKMVLDKKFIPYLKKCETCDSSQLYTLSVWLFGILDKGISH